MGDYTECFIKCRLKDLPKNVEDVLTYMFTESTLDLPQDLPDHPFFKTPRWCCIGKCSSYYHIPTNLNHFKFDDIAKCYYLISYSNIKNYHNEISLFFDWLNPYIDDEDGKFIGYSLTEYMNIPELFFKVEANPTCNE